MGQIITQKPAGIGTAFQQEREFEAKLQAIESEARLGALSEVENIVGKIVANFVMPSGTQARRLKMAAVEKLASDANAMANRFPANPKAREVARRITLKLSEIYKKMSLLHEIETRIASLETEAANFKAEIERCNREEASARTAKDGRAMALARSQIGAFGELLQEAETALSEARAEHRALAEPIWLRATRRIDGIYSTAAETAIVQALAAVGVKSSFHLKAGMPEMIAEALAEIPKPPVSANSASIAKAERFIAQIDGRTLAEIRQAASKF